jgi:hypothetical protein
MLISTVMIVAIAFMGLGFLLLLIRLFRMTMYFNNMWNDSMPWFMSNYLITTVALCGVTIIATPFSIESSFSPTQNSCENGCDRGGNISHPYFGLFGILVLGMCWWTLKAHVDHVIDMERYFSGVDVSLIAIGACILLSDLSLGICPQACP